VLYCIYTHQYVVLPSSCCVESDTAVSTDDDSAALPLCYVTQSTFNSSQAIHQQVPASTPANHRYTDVAPGLSVTTVNPAKTAEPIELPLWGQTPVAPINSPYFRLGTHGRHLANTIKLSVLGGDVGCHYHLLILPIIMLSANGSAIFMRATLC